VTDLLDVHRLRMLREVAGRGTIAAAAEAVALTPSAVSQHLSALERQVGTPLLRREGRGVALTEAGRVLAAHTERVLAELERARAAVAGLQGDVAGTVRLSAFPTAAGALVPAALAACRADHPDLQVMLEAREGDDAIAALRSGHLDLALVYEYDILPAIAVPGVELVRLVSESLLVALPPAPVRDESVVQLADLHDHHWIAPGSDTALHRTLERACGLARFAPEIEHTSDDLTVILALVAAGVGVSLIPQMALESATADVQLRPVTEPTLYRTVSIAARAGTRGNPAHAAVIDALRTAARALCERDGIGDLRFLAEMAQT
jgi:DNA-binding transcriptional LysR family regulator